MDHFAAIAALLEENGLDAMLLTEEANRFYATGFHSIGTDGCALVCRGKNYYFTDSRYTEAAARHVKNAELGEVGRGRDYAVLLNEVIEKEGLRRVGFDDAYMTVRDCEKYREKLHAELVPASDLLGSLRRVKDAEEIESMIAAQRIAEKALSDIFNEIKPGVTEKEIAARLPGAFLTDRFSPGYGDLPLDRPLYVLTNYSALWPAKAELEQMGERL